MITRIEVGLLPGVPDPRGRGLRAAAARTLGIELHDARTVAVYKFRADLKPGEADRIRGELADPVIEGSADGRWDPGPFDWAVTRGFRPGVTDNVGRTAAILAADVLGRPLPEGAAVFTETVWYLSGPKLDREKCERIAFGILANPVIHTVDIVSRREWESSEPDFSVPEISGENRVEVRTIDLGGDDAELMRISREGILSLSLDEMKAIRDHFAAAPYLAEREALGLGPAPADAELEALAQTWSEHCKHKIFNAVIRYREPGKPDETIRSLFQTYIRSATDKIGKTSDLLVSVFHDNAGVVRFNDRWNLVYKVETHNSPSALDPYGGAITGIVGVNRDPFGTGRGAALLANVWGYCLGSPFYDRPLPEGLLHPRRIRDGVHQGVIDGGNQSGIPYARGFEWFDERYIGKPLVFCGTLGLIPREVCGAPAHVKIVEPGHRIAMVGGRVGKDGIHGATFSSEELRKESPVQAVQIGDAFTQKKMTDFLLEARDRGLYTAITDNGAGGLSSSVGEMARMTGGCDMDLALAPCKYAGLQPWEILLSEAQERMTVALPPDKEQEFLALAKARDVEATVLGTFTSTGRFHVRYAEKTVAYVDMEFLHEGCPVMELEAEWSPPAHDAPDLDDGAGAPGAAPGARDLGGDLLALLGRLNICSNEDKARQYDHEVKGRSVIKPFAGRERDVPTDATVMLADQDRMHGVVLAEGINPRLSDIDTYWMAASVIDLAIRRIIAAGGEPGTIAGLDNFCWPDPVQSEKTPDGRRKLAQLVRANKALYDFTLAFQVPCISGKDSMKNDSVRGGVKISIPPTLLFSAVGRIADVRRAVTVDFKAAGHVIYVLGETGGELGGSEYLAMAGERARGRAWLGGGAPRVDAERARSLYAALHRAIGAGLVRSAHTPALGGLGAALAMAAMGGMLGAGVDLRCVPVAAGGPAARGLPDLSILFAESNSRFVVSVAPEHCAAFEQALAGQPCARAGSVTAEPRLKVRGGGGGIVVDLPVAALKEAWKAPLREAPPERPQADARPAAAAVFARAAKAAEEASGAAAGAERGRKDAAPARAARRVRSLVITGYGLNCEAETAFALERAGAAAEQVHLNDIISGKRPLNGYHMIALIGGFSFGDHIAAGKVYANRLKYKLAGQLREFIEDGNLLIGVCNGFQTLAKLGVLPGLDGGRAEQAFTVAWNDSGCFRDDWVQVRADPRTPCVFTRGIGVLDLPVRHGEGRFYLRDRGLLRRMDEAGLLALRYVDPRSGEPTMEFPFNPNGSLEAAAGVCDPTGRIFGLMPHPEAFALAINHPQWPLWKIAGGLPEEGAGLRIFRNAVEHLQRRGGEVAAP